MISQKCGILKKKEKKQPPQAPPPKSKTKQETRFIDTENWLVFARGEEGCGVDELRERGQNF